MLYRMLGIEQGATRLLWTQPAKCFTPTRSGAVLAGRDDSIGNGENARKTNAFPIRVRRTHVLFRVRFRSGRKDPCRLNPRRNFQGRNRAKNFESSCKKAGN